MTSLAETRPLDALAADGPDPDHAEELMLYGQFVGEWDFQWTGYDETGEATASGYGEWIFFWALEGRAVQDVWIIHERTRRGRAGVPEGEYGTTIRVYEPRAGTWNVTWNGPVQGVVRTFVARRSGDEIVQDGRDEDGRPLRWIFSEITPDSFRWGSVHSSDGEETWQLREEMHTQSCSCAAAASTAG